MKKLILIRHAKSSWEHDVIDHKRPLSKRGIKDANLVAKQLKSLGFTADLVLISDATRTTLTANIILPELNIGKEKIVLTHDLYDFSGINLTKVIKNCMDHVETLLVFGHNHAVTGFVNAYGSAYIDNVPTCGVVVIEFDTNEWSNISSGKTLTSIFPRDLRP